MQLFLFFVYIFCVCFCYKNVQKYLKISSKEYSIWWVVVVFLPTINFVVGCIAWYDVAILEDKTFGVKLAKKFFKAD